MADWTGRLVSEADYLAGLYRVRDRGAWSASVLYEVGDLVSYMNWQYITRVRHTSSNVSFQTSAANLTAVGALPDPNTYAMMRAGVVYTPFYNTGFALSTATVAANVTSIVRIPVGRTCTITAVVFENTATGTGPVDITQYTSDGAGGLLLVTTLASAVAANTTSVKTAAVSLPAVAGQDIYIGLTPTAVATFRKTSAFDPALMSNTAATQMASAGWTGYATTGKPSVVANSALTAIPVPRIGLLAAA